MTFLRRKSRTTEQVTLPDAHWEVIANEATDMGLSNDRYIAAAVRHYQYVTDCTKKGYRMVFVNTEGEIIQDPLFRLSEVD